MQSDTAVQLSANVSLHFLAQLARVIFYWTSISSCEALMRSKCRIFLHFRSHPHVFWGLHAAATTAVAEPSQRSSRFHICSTGWLKTMKLNEPGDHVGSSSIKSTQDAAVLGVSEITAALMSHIAVGAYVQCCIGSLILLHH